MSDPITINPTYRIWVAALILALFFAVAAYLMNRIYGSGTDATQWTQALVIFNAVSTLATTAAGVLLGVEVQQSNVQAANHVAADAQSRAEQSAYQTRLQREAMTRALATIESVEATARDTHSLEAGEVNAVGRAAHILREELIRGATD